MTTATTPLNLFLLRDLVLWAVADHDNIEDLKERFRSWGKWRQDVWSHYDPDEVDDAIDITKNGACGTAFCIAGQAVIQAGYALVFEEEFWDYKMEANLCAPAIYDGHDNKGKAVFIPNPDEDTHVYIEDKAVEVLGLTEPESNLLFSGDNGINEVVTIASEIAALRGLDLNLPDDVIAKHYSTDLARDCREYLSEES